MIIVTGTGRCGTGYLAQVLTALGLPCGHEQVITFSGGRRNLGRFVAESSWMATPFLRPGDHVILLYRSPALVIPSMLRMAFFQKPRVRRVSGLTSRDQQRNAETFYVQWNQQALGRADIVMNVERIDWGHLASLAGMKSGEAEEAARNVPTDYNTRGPTQPVVVPRPVWDMYERLEAA